MHIWDVVKVAQNKTEKFKTYEMYEKKHMKRDGPMPGVSAS